MLENFIYIKQKDLFIDLLEAGNVLDEAIVFIEDTREIWNHGTYFDGNTVDLSNIEASIQNILDNIPTKVSDLENDSGFITGEILTEVRDTLMSGPIQSLNNKTTRLENDKADKTELPTKTSDLINDNGFISNPIIPEQDGIYAITSDERIISLDEADETCIALALIKGPHKFWIDKYEHYSDETEIYLWDSTFYDTGIPNYTTVGGGSTSTYGYLNPDGTGLNLDYTTWEEGTALGDINGFENSEVLKTRDADPRNIGYVLNKFNAGEIGNNLGHNDWYIPACGQAALFCLHRDELNAALITIGGTELVKTSYWTSSEYATRDAWYINLWDYSVEMYSANKTQYTEFKVRLIRDIRTLDERFDNKQNIISDLASIREGAVLGATALQPEAISDMETKTNAATTYQPIGDYAKTSDIPTKVSELENDVPYVVDDVMPENGVYIVDLVGNLHTTDSWTGGSDATGVAVITDQVSIIVAPDEWYTNGGDSDGAWNGNTRSAWGGFGTTVTDTKTATNRSDAITDFAGSANTDAIISQLKSKTDDYSQYYTGAPAAEYCRAYSRGYKGAGQWYLPSAGEINVIIQNRGDVEEALNEISGELLTTGSWTSTQYSSNFAWLYAWDAEDFVRTNKYSFVAVRPVCTFTVQSLKERVKELESSKQNTLISGTNIKTINGESIVGSGDIVISSGSSSGGAYAEVNHGTNDTTFTLTPNTFHVWDEVATLDLSFGAETSGVANEYLFQFTSGATATTLTLPDDIKWANDTTPVISAYMIYQISVLKGLASVLEFSNELKIPVSELVYGNSYPEVYEFFLAKYTDDIPDASKPSGQLFVTDNLLLVDIPYGGSGQLTGISLTQGNKLFLWTEESMTYLYVAYLTPEGTMGIYMWD